MGRRWPLPPGIVTRFGHTEHTCHRGNRERGLVRAHEPEELDGSVPVSRANQAAAFDRISRSSRNCLFSRRSRANSSRSTAFSPAGASSRRLSFLSACETHARMEWPLGSNSRARSSGLRPARTRSTICRRNSGEYGGRVLGIGSTSGEKLQGVHQTGSIPYQELPEVSETMVKLAMIRLMLHRLAHPNR